MIRLGLVLLSTLCVLAAISCGGTAPANVNVAKNGTNVANSNPAQTPLPAATIDELASGKKLYMDNCANCHKQDGTGGEVMIEDKKLNPDDLTSAKIKGFPDDKILKYIMDGIEDEGMPAFKGKLSEGEMRDILKFIRVDFHKMPAATTPKS